MPRAASTAPAVAEGGAPPLPLRLAAVVALLAPIAMAVVAVVALAGHLWTAVLAGALIVVISAAGWYAVTARGAARGVGLGLAALAAAGLIALLATHWQGVVVLLVLLALLALFGLSARYALGRAGRAAAR